MVYFFCAFFFLCYLCYVKMNLINYANTKTMMFMAALCLLCCVACTPQKDTPKKLKVLSWNVWHGGHSKTYPGKGCEGTVGILKKSGADVVLMVETYGAAPMVADSLGYQYH